MDRNICALVTGAVRNTGLAVAEKFLSEGIPVFITSRKKEEAVEKAEELEKKYAVPCFGEYYDPRRAIDECIFLFERIKSEGFTVKHLVCTAANLGLNQNSLEVSYDEWENVFLTNVEGYFVPSRIAVKEMIADNIAGEGTIVYIGSINYRDAIPNRSAYVASKGAIRSMTKALALDFAKFGVRVNCIMPGPIWTSRYDADPAKAALKAKPVPIGRVSKTSEIAEAVWFFSSKASGNATGSGLIIDGGLDCVGMD